MIILESPRDALPLDVGRKLSRGVAAVEALQLIGGFSDPKWAVQHAPGLRPYLDANGEFYGAYGARIGDQFTAVHRKLSADPSTRQAVVTLWDPGRDNDPGHLDYPCTVAIGFSIRSNRLNMRVQMRSNDAWLGLPYDMFQFSQLQLALCNLLHLEPGSYVHGAWSLHLYATNLDESYEVVDAGSRTYSSQPNYGLGDGHVLPRSVMKLAHDLAYGKLNYDTMTWSERWYADALGQ